ncbi:MAG: hypothetical protein HBSAPP02_15420 [Phycisphaerae bacterium]|nr:MAG: hypothetical protein HBSAPP02_15420 [Phycisphaerae bacterium]
MIHAACPPSPRARVISAAIRQPMQQKRSASGVAALPRAGIGKWQKWQAFMVGSLTSEV